MFEYINMMLDNLKDLIECIEISELTDEYDKIREEIGENIQNKYDQLLNNIKEKLNKAIKFS